MSTVILFFIPLMSCNLLEPVDPVDLDHVDPVELEPVALVNESSPYLIPGEEGASWFLRDISGTAADSTLTYFTLDRSSMNSLEVLYEEYKASDEDANYFDFVFRYYFIVDISSQDDEHVANITGIKAKRNDSYSDPDDADFMTMLKDAGLEKFQLKFNETTSLIQIQTTSITYNLYPSYRYEQTNEESFKHDGKIRQGECKEFFYYSPMGDDFRLYASYYFTYTNDEGGTTTFSDSFDTYGERNQDSYPIQCEITQFSNRAYPRSFYSDSYISSLYEDFISDIGFSHFTEESTTEGMTLIFDNIENSSYTLQRSPIESQ